MLTLFSYNLRMTRNFYKKLLFALISLIPFYTCSCLQAQTIKGVVKDKQNGELLIGATVNIKGSGIGTTTDLDGKFNLEAKSLPATIQITYVGYVTKEMVIQDASIVHIIQLGSNETILKEVNITDSRLTEKQRESPLTVEALDIIAIKQTPAANFYEGLGALKGVDLTSASIGFKVINTRGFNSTSPVRSLQVIDGVDNQAPGLNFSLGNFLGSSELDVLKVDLVVGASSAFYGPNAFNGVISMSTRSPFVKPGFELLVKSGTRDMLETAMRYAVVFKNKEGKEKLGIKFNACVFKARDWEANNLSATLASKDNEKNPGGYDAVNIYGDEYSSRGDFSQLSASYPGLGRFYRTGYAEKDLVDYNTKNIKLNAAVHYKVGKESEIIASSNFGNGTTVYQGDNRYSLKDILFFQNRLELRKPNKYFIRAYVTNENAGNSYDAFFTALLLQKEAKSDNFWYKDYFNNYASSVPKIKSLPGYPQANQYPDYQSYIASINPFLLNNYYDSLLMYHANAEANAQLGNSLNATNDFLTPGTYAFDTAFANITSRESFSQGGSKFYDKSALYHVHGEYKFDLKFLELTTGANYRKYTPDSRGTIFADTNGRVITNYEWGTYAGIDKKVMSDKIKLNATVRLDKNENFDYLVSPAFSGVYSPNQNHTFRVSFSSAIRNPTLGDQYLFYKVGRATLIGNLNGFDSLVTTESLVDAYSTQNVDTLSYFNVDPVKPEKVQTIEVGYRNTLFGHLYSDFNAYFSRYHDFIGYKIGADVNVVTTPPPFSSTEIFLNDIYRVATNSKDVINTYGISYGINYFFKKYYTVAANWSLNILDRRELKIGSKSGFPFFGFDKSAESTDPLIPAFNTPRNKYNIGISGNEIQSAIGNNWGFNINYKWVEGFRFEGSPQFTGNIPSYSIVDVQVNKKFIESKTTLKVGATNILNNEHYEVFGGPLVGRMLYFQILVEIN